jgi:phospholipase C
LRRYDRKQAKFKEDNGSLGRIGDQSFDEKAGSILNMFNFTSGYYADKLFLDPSNGTAISLIMLRIIMPIE